MLNYLIFWHKLFFLLYFTFQFSCGSIINTTYFFIVASFFFLSLSLMYAVGSNLGFLAPTIIFRLFFPHLYVPNILLHLKSINMILIPHQLLLRADLQVTVSDSLVCSCYDLNRKTMICYWNGCYWLRRVALLRRGDLEKKTSLSLTSGRWTMICLEIKISPLLKTLIDLEMCCICLELKV